MPRRLASSALTRVGSALDRAALRVMERTMTRSGPTRAPENAVALLGSLAEHYDKLGDGFFPAPTEPVVRESHGRRGRKTGLIDLSFASEYSASLPNYAEELRSHTANNKVFARLFTRGGGRPTIIAIHGWGTGQYWFEERAFQVARFLDAGFDVALFQMPFHHQRAPTGSSRSGALFPSAHVVRTNEAFGQAIWDLRRLALYLRNSRGIEWLGVMGMSLGGYTAALWASLDESLNAAVPIIPAVSMAELMWRHGEDSPLQARAAKAGVNRELLADVFSVHAPLSRPSLLAHDSMMIVAGRGDRITPSDQVESLWTHWQEPRIHWFAGGHLAQVGRGRAFSEIRSHLTSVS